MAKYKNSKKIIIFILIASFFFLPASASLSFSNFEQRKQAWLARDGKSVKGVYFTLLSRGLPHIFAWLEKGKYFTVASKDVPGGDLRQQIMALIPWIGKAGSLAGPTLIRILYQYKDVLEGKVCPNGHCYPYPNDWAEINKAFYSLSRSEGVISRTGSVGESCSTQPTRTILAYLYTLEDKDASFLCGQSGLCSKEWVSPHSGFTYRPGNYYNTHKYTRDALYNFFDQCILKGNNELDGSYTSITIQGLLTLYDFAGRPLARLNNQPDPEGLEMKKRAKMMLDFMLLEQAMDFSANHHGSALGRTYQNNIIKSGQQSQTLYSLLGLGPTGTAEIGAMDYMSSYRPSPLIEDLTNIEKETDNYWHINKENNFVSNQKGDTGKWTYITKYYNLGGAQTPTANWQFTLKSNNPLFRLWINRAADSATHCSGDWMSSCNVLWGLGSGPFYQYRNAFFSEIHSPHLHIVKGEKFDYGEKNLLINYSDACKDYQGNTLDHCDRDYKIRDGWNFFQKGQVAFALNIRDRAQALEAAIIGVDYGSFNDFQDAVLGRNGYSGAELSTHYFKTSKGDIITDTRESGIVGGTVNGKPIWHFPFKRIETVYGYGNEAFGNLLNWNNKVMTISKNGLTCQYDFNNWTYNGNGCGGEGSSTGNLLADFNCDGKVNIQDLGIMLSHWGKTGTYQSPKCDGSKDLDLDLDNIIGPGDIIKMFGRLLKII